MAYQVKCDGYPLFDARDERLVLVDPRVKVEVNTVGEGSFTIYNTHPYYGMLQKMRSVIEVSDEVGVIFRGRMTNDSIYFNNGKAVDIEGVMAFFNDSIVRPYTFPDDFAADAEYKTAAASGNVVAFFLKWLIDNHNSQVQEFQRFKLGNVTVSDPNNYITRSDEGYTKTWDVLKAKLFESSLGGYLCIRYEDDGNYIDYLEDFILTNTQDIVFGENMLDLLHEQDASETYSAIIPIGKDKLTLASLSPNYIPSDSDIVREGDTLYSKSAVEKFGKIYAPVGETTWDDITVPANLADKGCEYLAGKAIMLSTKIEITAADLHFTDSEIRSFRIYRKQRVYSVPHDISATYELTSIDIDILNPQNTKITVGDTALSLTEITSNNQSGIMNRVEIVEKDLHENASEITEIKNTTLVNMTSVTNTCNEIVFSALESYTEESVFDSFKKDTESQFKQTAKDISMNFTTTTENINKVGEDLQKQVDELNKCIRFTADGIIIGDDTSGLTIQVDNDIIRFSRNGVVFGSWNGSEFISGTRAKFGDFAFIPRSDGISFEKV
jgi:hypothetical protein